MAEMKIKGGPLRITVTDDAGRTVAALRYPKLRWTELVVEAEDADLDVESLGDRRVRLTRRIDEAPADSKEQKTDPLDAARQMGESLDVLVRDFAKGVKDLLGL